MMLTLVSNELSMTLFGANFCTRQGIAFHVTDELLGCAASGLAHRQNVELLGRAGNAAAFGAEQLVKRARVRERHGIVLVQHT